MGTFPAGPLGIEADLYLSEWTACTSYVYQRDVVSITRGRQNESATIAPAQCTMTLNNRDNRFTIRNPEGAWYGLIGQNTPFRLSVPNSLTGGGTYLRMEDDNVSSASCPDSSGLQITGTLDVRVDCQPSGYNGSQELIGKATGSGTPAWMLTLNPDGTVTLFWWTSGDAINSATSTAPLPYLGRIMIRAVLSISGLTCTFYTAATMAGSETQLGSVIAFTSTTLNAGAGTAVAVGCSFSGGVNGQFYEAQVYSGIGGSGGTLEANPVFTSQTAGATSFADVQGNTWTINGTAELSNRLYRYHGELASLPKAADPSQHDVYSNATASGILRRLSQGQNPTNSAMYRAYTRLGGSIAPVAYWPCEDGTNATQLASALPDGLPMNISGVPQLASSTQFTCSDALPQIGASVWNGDVVNPGGGWNANVLRFLLYETAGTIPDNTILIRMHTSGAIRYVDLVYTTVFNGTLTLNGYDNTGTEQFTTTGDFAVDGKELRISVELQPSAPVTTTYGIFVMQPGGGVTESTGTWSSTDVLGAVTSILVNPDGKAMGSAVIGHISVQDNWDTLYDLTQPLNAWLYETAGNRYLRLCSEEGIGCRITGFPDDTVEMGYQTLETIPDLLQECEYTDMGMQFEPRTCLGLGYVTRAALYNQAAVLAADYSLGQVTQGFSAASDDQLVINDVTLSNLDGSTARQVLEAGAMSVLSPPDGIGRVDTSVSVNAGVDSDLSSLANWLLWVRTVNDDRYPVIPFNLAKDVVAGVVTPAAVPLLDVGNYLQVINTPGWIPPGPARQLCAGFTETLGPEGVWTIGVNGIPEMPYEVAAAGTSHVDTDGSTLTSTITSTATSMSVTTVSGAPVWTTSGGDFPFDILMAGERMTVTNITSSTSPQTFTVTRSVNGVVKAQAGGTSLALWNTPVAAL